MKAAVPGFSIQGIYDIQLFQHCMYCVHVPVWLVILSIMISFDIAGLSESMA